MEMDELNARFHGFFLVIFSMFKLFDPEGFVDGFQTYDLLAKPVRDYAIRESSASSQSVFAFSR